MTFDFRRDAEGRPLWHNPRLNPDFDPHRPYEPDNHPFSTCALCGETWPCDQAKARTAPVEVSGIWLRRADDELQVLAEIEGEWRLVIREAYTPDSPLSHIVEPLGMRHARRVS